MIKNIIFDMGGVLVDYYARRFVEKCVQDPGEQKLLLNELFHSVEWIQLDRGSITEEQLLRQVCSRLPNKLHAMARHLLECWHDYAPPIPGTEELCVELKKNGYRLYLLSNTGVRFYLYRDKVPALRQFDGEFISADWQLLKPEAAIYRTFCHHFNLVPAECFFIDDVPANIEGAMRIGMSGYVYRQDNDALRAALRATGVKI